MAFRSDGPVVLAFPPFRGFTRRIILTAAAVFLASVVLGLPMRDTTSFLVDHLMLHPDDLRHAMIWELATYPFIEQGLLSLLFALLTVWFFGSAIEDDRGQRWFAEYFFSAAIGGGLLASVLCFAAGRWVPGLDPATSIRAFGLWPASLAILLAYARFHGNEEIRFNFVFRIKAKFLVAGYVGFYLLLALLGRDRFGVLVTLSNAVAGWIFLQFAPRKGLRFAASESWYSLRNGFYRAKRRRAAKEFEVYMGKQGKNVKVDDTDDKKWMN